MALTICWFALFFGIISNISVMFLENSVSDSDTAPVFVQESFSIVDGGAAAPVFSDPVPSPRKVALDDVKWLQHLNSTITLEGKEYNLGLNETDTSFGNCTAEGEAGECRHIKFCALDVFQNEISLFKPYQCPITGEFLGVCCPHNVS